MQPFTDAGNHMENPVKVTRGEGGKKVGGTGGGASRYIGEGFSGAKK